MSAGGSAAIRGSAALRRRATPGLPRPAGLLVGLALAIAGHPAGPAGAVAGPWRENPQSRVRLVSPYRSAPQRGELLLGVEFRLAPGWHVYWKNSGDAGLPPAVDLSGTPEVGGGELLWPSPERYELPGGLEAYGYGGQVLYPLRIRLEAAGRSSLAFRADLDYLTCEVDCIPYRYRLSLEQPLAEEASRDPELAPLLEEWLARVPRPAAEVPSLSLGAALAPAPGGDGELRVRIEGPGVEASALDLFFEAGELFTIGRPRATATEGGALFRAPLALRDRTRHPPPSAELAWVVTGLRIPGGPTAVAARRSLDLGPLARPEAPRGATAGATLPAIAGAGLLGGMLLNLTPTVLALFLLRLAAWRRGDPPGATRVRASALGSAAALLGSFGLLAGVALLLQRAGLPAGWGMQLQRPGVTAALTVVVLAFSLHLWGQLDLPDGRRKDDPAGGFAAGLAGGGLAALLALPWTMPFLGRATSLALSRSPGAVLTAFGAASLGLALPYLAVGAAPGNRRLLPATWAASRRLPEALGFLPAASAIWLLYALSRQVDAPRLAFCQLGLLGVAAAATARSAAATGSLRVILGGAMVAAAAITVWIAEAGGS